MKKLFLLLSFIGLFGCAEEKKKTPPGLLPPAKLTSILADIHVAESRVEIMRVNPDTAKVVFNRLQKEVLQKHGVSEKDFNKTYDYYLDNLEALDKIYEGLVDTLGMREVKLASVAGKTTKSKKGSQHGLKPDTTKITDTAELRRAKLKNLK